MPAKGSASGSSYQRWREPEAAQAALCGALGWEFLSQRLSGKAVTMTDDYAAGMPCAGGVGCGKKGRH